METVLAVLAAIGAFLIVSRPIALLATIAADRVMVYALSTPSKDDDKAAKSAQKIAYGALAVLDFLAENLPVVARGIQDSRK